MTAPARPVRRCVVTGERGDKAGLIRFVVGPDGRLVPDIGERLPGRGFWVRAERRTLDEGLRKGRLLDAARRVRGRASGAEAPLAIEDDLADRVETLLAEAALRLLGLARRSGALVTGLEAVRKAVAAGTGRPAFALVIACDAAEDGLRKLALRGRDLPLVRLFGRDELSLALGLGNVVHAALTDSRSAMRFMREAERLAGFRVSCARGRAMFARKDGSE